MSKSLIDFADVKLHKSLVQFKSGLTDLLSVKQPHEWEGEHGKKNGENSQPEAFIPFYGQQAWKANILIKQLFLEKEIEGKLIYS